MMPYFYGIYFGNNEAQSLFDLMRLILQPDYARKAHITLRGPYEKKPTSKKWLHENIGDVYLLRPEHFFIEEQNTVFLKVDFFGLNEIFWKKDYPDGIPHLSIYDGSDRSFAWQVLLELKEHKWKISIPSSPVSIIEKKHRYEENFYVQIDRLDIAFEAICEKPISYNYIRSMHNGQRLYLLRKICRRIHEVTRPFLELR